MNASGMQGGGATPEAVERSRSLSEAQPGSPVLDALRLESQANGRLQTRVETLEAELAVTRQALERHQKAHAELMRQVGVSPTELTALLERPGGETIAALTKLLVTAIRAGQGHASNRGVPPVAELIKRMEIDPSTLRNIRDGLLLLYT